MALAHATRGQIIAYCVQYSHADICNGGFHQYFSNLGDIANVTHEALTWIGEGERARLLKKAMGRFPKGVAPRSRAECERLLAAIDDWRTWIDPIEEAYYAHDPEGVALDRAVTEYVASHPDEFFLDD